MQASRVRTYTREHFLLFNYVLFVFFSPFLRAYLQSFSFFFSSFRRFTFFLPSFLKIYLSQFCFPALRRADLNADDTIIKRSRNRLADKHSSVQSLCKLMSNKISLSTNRDATSASDTRYSACLSSAEQWNTSRRYAQLRFTHVYARTLFHISLKFSLGTRTVGGHGRSYS